MATNSRYQFVDEQLRRLQLLDSYYQTDRDRLLTVIEASRVFHELPEGTCPLCNRGFTAEETRDTAHQAFEQACVSEVQKIELLRADLRHAIDDSSTEIKTLTSRSDQLAQEIQQAEQQLAKVLAPSVQSAHSELQSLIHKRATVAQAATVKSTIQGLEERLAQIAGAQKVRVPTMTFEPRSSTSATFEFCGVVEEILRAWNYPNLGAVAYDTEKADLVIGGQDRANKGKGYRALTYAAFAIGLMRYCRQKSIPHPGFVVLDTPVNPFKGPKTISAADSVTDDVKVAFFEYLAADNSGDQIIVMENVEPPASVLEASHYHAFTKNPSMGRYGFFPLNGTVNTVATSQSI